LGADLKLKFGRRLLKNKGFRSHLLGRKKGLFLTKGGEKIPEPPDTQKQPLGKKQLPKPRGGEILHPPEGFFLYKKKLPPEGEAKIRPGNTAHGKNLLPFSQPHVLFKRSLHFSLKKVPQSLFSGALPVVVGHF